ncbi:hypothetical protein [Actinacidiphila guanduensis]|uniref:hypothetical protein n=1 Tax=Actinacidiphila guanduensis TaxID=310781 RepID=UPI00115F87E1|nr:hypothetical protein [Actinacidiphila guanduensis]
MPAEPGGAVGPAAAAEALAVAEVFKAAELLEAAEPPAAAVGATEPLAAPEVLRATEVFGLFKEPEAVGKRESSVTAPVCRAPGSRRWVCRTQEKRNDPAAPRSGQHRSHPSRHGRKRQ